MTVYGRYAISIDRVAAFKDLQLYGMAEAMAEWLAEQPRHKLTPEAVIDRLVTAEQSCRRARSLSYQLKVAKFPIHRDFLGFNWQESPVSQTQTEQLATAALWIMPII